MDFNIEADFVRKCIKKECQERLLFELHSTKHREKAISRFSHSAESVLKKGFINCSISDLQNKFYKTMQTENCYIISGDSYDGKIFSFAEAIEHCKTSYMAIVLISSKIIAVREELEKTQPLLFVYVLN